ncbi:MAG TPA: FHA domain-containing serine/threonine-protein kinase [Planctomycetaceae bacterium]|nr:FHA domain-containing serine/threonine-protein kinase [Planctomycetaceae bacterium]
MSDSQVAASAFLELLAESRLLSNEQIADAVDRFGLDRLDTAHDAAKRLVQERVLTRYQAERLLDGRARGFFIDRYKVLEILGFGGMGSLYLAEDLETGEHVALKVLTERHKLDSGMLARLKLEAAAGVRLHHPHIIRTRAVDDTGAICYVVMEFVKGISVFELLTTKGKPSWQQSCDIIVQAAAALEHAHQAGIIHRDVKPDNLLIDRQGFVKLLDFGLALVTDEADSEFSLAMIFGHDCLGTADYIAPEQSFDSQKVDARSDVYSLGCTFYLLLAAQYPFPEKSTSAKIEAHRNRPPRPLAELAPAVPAEVIAVVEKMMAKRPEDRFASMAEVRAALEPFAERRPVEFSFNRMLSQRADEARQRTAAERRSRARRRLSSSVATASSVASSARRHGNDVETMVGGDTQPLVARAKRRLRDSGAAEPAPIEPTDATARRLTASMSATLPVAVLVSLDEPREFPLTRERIVIGRDAGCDISLPVAGISGRHCELRAEGAWWAIADLDSKNGIEVNGLRVGEQILWPGDVITIGRRCRFRIIDPDAPQGKRFARWKLLVGLAALAAAGGAAAWMLLGG